MRDRTELHQYLKSLPNELAAWEEHFKALGISQQLLTQTFPRAPLPNLFRLYCNCERLANIRINKELIKVQYGWQLWALCDEEEFIYPVLERISNLIPRVASQG